MLENFDMLMEQVGNQSRYQLRLFFILCLTIGTISLQMSSLTYLFIIPELSCNATICFENEQVCQQETYVVSPKFQYTNVVSQFRLFCDDHKWISILTSITFLGATLGGSMLSLVADRKGRKTAFILSWMTATTGYITTYLSETLWLYTIGSFITGFGQIGAYILMPVMLNEVCSTRIRQIYSLGLLVVWSLYEMLAALLYYYITDWHIVQLYFIIIPAVLVLVLCQLIFETPKYYYSQGNYSQLLITLNQIATVNNISTLSELPHTLTSQAPVKQPNYGYIVLLKYKSLRLPSIGFFMISFALHLTYYGGQYGLRSIYTADMVFIMGALIGLGECLAYLTMAFIVSHLQRKRTLLVSFSITGLCCLLFLFHDCQPCEGTYTIVLTCLIRVFNTVGFSLQALFANEFYPTPVRALGTGFLFSVGIVGSFTSPYVIYASEQQHINPYIAIGLISLIGPIGTLLTEETFRKPLKDQLDEVEVKLQQISKVI